MATHAENYCSQILRNTFNNKIVSGVRLEEWERNILYFKIEAKEYSVSYNPQKDIRTELPEQIEKILLANFPKDYERKLLERNGMCERQLYELYLDLHRLFGELDGTRVSNGVTEEDIPSEAKKSRGRPRS